MRSPARLAVVLALAAGVAAMPMPMAGMAGVPTAGAQEPVLPEDPTTTTIEVPTTPTTVDVPTTAPTTTRRPGGDTDKPTTTSTSTTLPEDPLTVDDGVAEEVPVVDLTVPPPPPPVGGDELAAQYRPGRVVVRPLGEARSVAATALTEAKAAHARVADVTDELAARRRRLTRLEKGRLTAVSRLRRARETLNTRAAWAYVRGPLTDLTGVLESGDPNQLYTRMDMVKGVLDADRKALENYQDARDEVGAELARATEAVTRARKALKKAKKEAVEADRRVDETKLELAIFASGSEVVIHGFVFPVADPHNFVDTFMAPRMPGTEYQHLHQGTDIFAPSGTELLAAERGVVARMGTDVLGGIKLWLVGESGTYYYYAHLSAYGQGIKPGLVVEAGTVVGHVGNTGNARTTPSHLHFEIHPGGDEAVNPYPLLKYADDHD